MIGKYGHLRLRYLKQHRPIIYTNLLTSCELSEHLAEVEKECTERMDSLVKAMAKQEGVTEALKAADQWAWVRRMNNIRYPLLCSYTRYTDSCNVGCKRRRSVWKR